MWTLRTPTLLFAASTLLVGCAGGGGPSTQAPRDYNVITLEEIQATDAPTAFHIVQQLRPRWMVRNRGDRSFAVDGSDYAKVMVDDFPPREFDYLRELRREVLMEIRYLEPRDATLLYGTGYNAGVIKVTTKH